MEVVAYFISTPQPWYALSLCTLLLFAFRADSAATALGLTIVDPSESPTSTKFSLREMVQLFAIIALVLAAVYVLKRSEFSLTLAALLVLCGYIWVTGYRNKIRLLQKTGLSSVNSVVLVSLFTIFSASLFVALAMSAWTMRSAP